MFLLCLVIFLLPATLIHTHTMRNSLAQFDSTLRTLDTKIVGSGKQEQIKRLLKTGQEVDALEGLIKENKADEDDYIYNDGLLKQFSKFWHSVIINSAPETIQQDWAGVNKSLNDFASKFKVGLDDIYKKINSLVPEKIETLTENDKQCLCFAFFKLIYNKRAEIAQYCAESIIIFSLNEAPVAEYLQGFLSGWKYDTSIPGNSLKPEIKKLFTDIRMSGNEELIKIIDIANNLCRPTTWGAS